MNLNETLNVSTDKINNKMQLHSYTRTYTGRAAECQRERERDREERERATYK